MIKKTILIFYTISFVFLNSSYLFADNILSNKNFSKDEIRILSIEGDASYKQYYGWEKLTGRTFLQEGVKISTGINSRVILKLNGSTIDIKQLTMIKINSSGNGQKEIYLSIGRGTILADIKTLLNTKTTFKIETPVATTTAIAEKGSPATFEVKYEPLNGMTARSIRGKLLGTNFQGTQTEIKGNLVQQTKCDEAPVASKDITIQTINSKQEVQIIDKQQTSTINEDTITTEAAIHSDGLGNEKASIQANVETEWP